MGYDPKRHHRRSIRLKGYDYSQEGGYFVTITTHHRELLFGQIVDGEMRLSEFGRIVREEWLRTSLLRPNVELDAFVIMPNHLHGILILWNNRNGGKSVRANSYSPPQEVSFRSPSRTVGAIVRGIKSATTTRINTIRNTPGSPVWQRNYYEHIIRDLDELGRIREYIRNNVLQWYYEKGNEA